MLRALVLVLIAAFLSGCGSRGPVKRVFPPEVRVQELRVAGEAPALQLRVQSFSTVPSEVLAYDLVLEIAGQRAATLRGTPRLTVLPQAAEAFPAGADFDAEALGRARAALANGTALRYRLHGTVSVRPNGRAYPIDYSSALSPVPGLDGVLR